MRLVASLKLKSTVVQEFNLARERNEVRRLVFATGTGRRSVACQPHKIAAVERGGGEDPSSRVASVYHFGVEGE